MSTESLETGKQEKDLKAYNGPEGVVKRWLKEWSLIKNSKAQLSFEETGEKVIKLYRNADSLQSTSKTSAAASRAMVNLLWSNVQVLKPCVFARLPKVVVERRFKDSDPVGRLSCQIAERATSYSIADQKDRIKYAIAAAVEDCLLPGRGNVWLRYERGETQPAIDSNGEPIIDPETNQPIQIAKPGSERVLVDPLHWLDYYETPGRNPYEIRAKFRRAYMTRAELRARFGDIAKEVELDHIPTGSKRSKLTPEEQEFLAQAEVLEIWDSEAKQTIWISEGYKKGPLDQKPDTLHLKDFFPCPIPLLATTTTDSNYPTADYKIYERLADEVDYVTKRISSLIDCVRFVGAIAAQYRKDMDNILKLNDGEVWPIDAWQQFVEKEGFKGIVDWIPFDRCVEAIEPLMKYRDDLLTKIDMIIGIPDIVRGMTDPNETAEAQQRKSRWTSVKLQQRQADVQRFCCEIVNKIAEIIFEPGLFTDETIMLMSGFQQLSQEDQQLFPQALDLLRNDRLRTFRVDIETDSTIAIDEQEDQNARMGYIAAIKDIISNVQAISEFRPELMTPVVESALFAVRSFRTGRPLEGAWENALKKIEENDAAAAANPPPPPPDPEQVKGQIAMQLEQMKEQFTMQLEQMKAGSLQQLEQFKASVSQQQNRLDNWTRLQIATMQTQKDAAAKAQDAQIEFQRTQFDAQTEALKHQHNVEIEIIQAKADQTVAERQAALEREKATFEAQIKLAEQAFNMKIESLKAAAEIQKTNADAAASMMQAKSATAESSKPKEASTPIQLHVHTGGKSKKIKLKRGADGTLEGSSEEVDEDPKAAEDEQSES